MEKHVVFHSPGPLWKAGVGFREQPCVIDHVQHYAHFFDSGSLLMGGQIRDLDSGGMMIAAEGVARNEPEFAAADPAVLSGLLNFEVKCWYVAMSS